MDSDLEALRAYLYAAPPGVITDTEELERLLASCWTAFAGSDESSMAAYKLGRGIEEATWDPPWLHFLIERHGGTVLGSTRAERQGWTLNMDTRKAHCASVGFRQVKPRAAPLDARKLASELLPAMVEGRADERLRWNDDATVRVQIAKIIPEGPPKQTLMGRRKRFRAALTELVREAGGEEVRPNVYRLPRRGRS